MPRYLLLIGCSASKRRDSGLLPASVRYTGMSYKVIHKAKREGYWPAGVEILILSAKYGLIPGNKAIRYYDMQMTRARAIELRPSVASLLDFYFARNSFEEVFINLGKIYRLAVADSSALVAAQDTLIWAEGGIGVKLGQMKQWILDLKSREAEMKGKVLSQ